MNWNIFYAVAIGLLTVIVAGLAGQLAATKPWHKWVFWGAGLITVGLIYLQARSNEEQSGANALKEKQLLSQLNDIKQKMEDNQRASVGLYDIYLWPNQELAPGKKISAQIRYVVKDGVAKNYRVFDEIFSFGQKWHDELDKQAIEKFRKDSIGKFDYRGEDKVPPNGSQRTLQITFNEAEVSQVIAGTRTVYAVGRVEWNNPAGADFHIEVCYWLQPPATKALANLGWHICHP